MKIAVQASKCQPDERGSRAVLASGGGAGGRGKCAGFLHTPWLRDNIPRGPTRRVSTGCGVQMAIVTIRDGEPPEGILSRFRAAVTRGGILKEHKDRKFFRSKGEKQRLAARRSARRRRRVTAR